MSEQSQPRPVASAPNTGPSAPPEAGAPHVGLVGLAVMGENLALNIERRGYPVAVYNRELKRVDAVVANASGRKLIATRSPEEFVKAIERPRKIILLV